MGGHTPTAVPSMCSVFAVLCGAEPAGPAQHPQVEGAPGVLEGRGCRHAVDAAPEGTLVCQLTPPRFRSTLFPPHTPFTLPCADTLDAVLPSRPPSPSISKCPGFRSVLRPGIDSCPGWGAEKGAFGVLGEILSGAKAAKQGISVLCPYNLLPPPASASLVGEARGSWTESFAGTQSVRSVVETVWVEMVAVSSRF